MAHDVSLPLQLGIGTLLFGAISYYAPHISMLILGFILFFVGVSGMIAIAAGIFGDYNNLKRFKLITSGTLLLGLGYLLYRGIIFEYTRASKW